MIYNQRFNNGANMWCIQTYVARSVVHFLVFDPTDDGLLFASLSLTYSLVPIQSYTGALLLVCFVRIFDFIFISPSAFVGTFHYITDE